MIICTLWLIVLSTLTCRALQSDIIFRLEDPNCIMKLKDLFPQRETAFFRAVLRGSSGLHVARLLRLFNRRAG